MFCQNCGKEVLAEVLC